MESYGCTNVNTTITITTTTTCTAPLAHIFACFECCKLSGNVPTIRENLILTVQQHPWTARDLPSSSKEFALYTTIIITIINIIICPPILWCGSVRQLSRKTSVAKYGNIRMNNFKIFLLPNVQFDKLRGFIYQVSP
uniref:Uncharacterized protein n=1 Tax=Anopheles culicifacies TaxID=139723 RepID=A0A182MEU2_9DIPT